MKKLLLFIFVSLLFSCNSKKEADSILGLFSDDIEEIQSTTVQVNVLLGAPQQIHKIGSTLLVVDHQKDHLIHVIDLLTGEARKILRPGRGPDELLPPILFSQIVNDTIVNILERSTSTIVQYYLKDILYEEDPRIITKTILQGYAESPQYTGEFYVAGGEHEEGKMLAFFDKQGRKTHEYIPFPEGGNRFSSESTRYAAYQSNIKISPDGKKLVQAGLYYDLFCFYNIDKDRLTEHKKYFFNDAKVKQSGERIVPGPNTLINFLSLYPTRNSIYALYAGYEYGGKVEDRKYYILRFDWSGKPLKAYKLDNYMYSFWVDETGTELYGVSPRTSEILRYEL